MIISPSTYTRPSISSPNVPRIKTPYGWPQVTGSFIAYFILILFFSRRYLQGIFKEAWHGSNQSGEVFSPRTSLLVLFFCAVGILIWGEWLEIPKIGSIIIFAVFVSFSFVAVKLRAECGTPGIGYYPYRYSFLIPFVGGIGVLGPNGAMSLLMALLIFKLVFFAIPGIGLEMLQIGRELRIHRRHIVATAVVGVFGGIFIGGIIHLTTLYGSGVDNFENIGSYDPRTNWSQFDPWHEATTDRYIKGKSLVSSKDFINPTGAGMAFAAGGTAVITVLRQFFAGFWFHPIGFMLGPSEMMRFLWGSILAAFVIRFAVLKIGGARTVRNQLYPFALGMVLGSAFANALFVLLNFWIFKVRPESPSILGIN